MATRRVFDAIPRESKGRAFIDLEASGLNARSWPIEAGWAFEDGGSHSVLIAPDAAWPDDAWDPAAEALHGLDRETLRRQGATVAEACRLLNEALADFEVYSDAPEWDAFWIYRLFDAAKAKPAFTIRSFGELVTPLIAGREDAVFEEAARLAPRRHRAAEDARHLQTLYRLAAAKTL